MTNLSLNGFHLGLSAKSLTFQKLEFADNKGLRALRAAHPNWFIYWRDGTVYALPNVPNPAASLGVETTDLCTDHLQLIAARITDLLPTKFPGYPAFQRRPFSFVARRKDEEIVQTVTKYLKNRPSILDHFTIRPSFYLEAKIVETRGDEVLLGLFLNVGTNWQITAAIDQLARVGISLAGLCVVRRDYKAGERRLVGEIDCIQGDRILLADAFDDLKEISLNDVYLEGSKQSFSRCLKVILGSEYESFEERRYREESGLLSGPEIENTLDRFAKFFSDSTPLEISPQLEGKIGERIQVTNRDVYKSILIANKVKYYFDPARSKTSDYAWLGIKNYGPFSKDTFAKRSPDILVIFPETAQGQTETFLKYLRDGVPSVGSSSQYPGGFAKLFGLANPTFHLCKVATLGNSLLPSINYRQTIEKHLSSCAVPPDAAIVVLTDEQGALPDDANPYLSAKATLLLAGIPSQELRISRISRAPVDLQYILQNVSVALYAKMNGTPWTVNQDKTISDELVIGLGSSEIKISRFGEKQRFVGITTVFQGDGNYLLSQISKECTYEEYPGVLFQSTQEILEEIKRRNGWNKGDNIRLIFHTYKPLRNVEIAEIVKRAAKSVGSEQTIEFAFLTVSLDHPFLIIDPAQAGVLNRQNTNGTKGKFVPERGTIVQIGRYTRLLATNGPMLIKREPAPLPKPLLVHIHKQSTFHDLSYLTEQVLKFTSLSWRSTLPAKKPVTIYYSELIANLLGRLRNVKGWTPAVLNLKLRASRWFL